MKERKKQGKHSKKRKVNNCIYNIIILMLVGIIIYSGINIYIWYSENKKSKEIKKELESAISIDETQENTEKYTVDFIKLKEKNSDTVAWIKVPNTSVEYPIVRTTNNSYYLNHSFDKSSNKAGWIFMDYKNKLDGTDKNIVIYGHNRKDGSMFGSMQNILKEEWYNNPENYTLSFITENSKDEYQVFSIYKIENEEYYIKTNFNSDNEYKNFVKTIKSRSIKDFGVDVTEKDQILTISTCGNDNNYRVVLHARKVSKI